jgi:LacI family transcriptional regulator, galactose operon repressor
MVKHGVKSIAQLAGVSPATVSLALNGDPRVADKTRERVKTLADELGYIPNSFGRALQSNKSNLVGFLLSEVNNSYFSEIFQGAGERATEHNYAILVAITHHRHQQETEQLNAFLGKQVEGIIIDTYNPATMDDFFAYKRHNVPTVFLSAVPDNSSFIVVKNDDWQTGIIAVEHLISLGHKRLAFCFSSILSQERHQSTLECCRQNNISGCQAVITAEELQHVLRSPNRPTAIIAYSDEHAVQVMHIAMELGLSVPEDLSIIGVDDSNAARLPAYNLTTIAPQKQNIGRTAISTILDLIAGKTVQSTYLKPELIIRNTTAVPGI